MTMNVPAEPATIPEDVFTAVDALDKALGHARQVLTDYVLAQVRAAYPTATEVTFAANADSFAIAVTTPQGVGFEDDAASPVAVAAGLYFAVLGDERVTVQVTP